MVENTKRPRGRPKKVAAKKESSELDKLVSEFKSLKELCEKDLSEKYLALSTLKLEIKELEENHKFFKRIFLSLENVKNN